MWRPSQDIALRGGNLDYRADIDGLRAIAVLAVVLFHIDPDWVPGGFAGVDIFFVISGFIITRLIAHDVAAGTFSLRNFYLRRVKRIAPVLMAVIAVTLMAGQIVLIPEHLKELAQSAVASVLSAANIFFTYGVDTGYFADDNTTRPLLHLWSLGVEEQFYLIWPVIVSAALMRFSLSRVLIVTAAAFVVFLMLSETLAQTAPVFAYYMLPSRAFQLLAGALIALSCVQAGHRLSLYRIGLNFAGMAGVFAVALSLAFIGESKTFPGINALPATLGAALIILSGIRSDGLVARILSLRPLVLIGTISYSLYLWHWPIVAYLHYALVPMTLPVKLGALAVMFMLSAASFLLIEAPCRKSALPARIILKRQLVMPAVALCAVSALFIVTQGFGVRLLDRAYVEQVSKLAAGIKPAHDYPYICQRERIRAADMTDPRCIINGTSEPDVLLWGDSNAAHYVGLIGELARKEGIGFRNIAHASCPPTTSAPSMSTARRFRAECIESRNLVKSHLDRYTTIIVAGAWSVYRPYEDLYSAMRNLIEELRAKGKTVVILGEIVRFPDFDRYCKIKELLLPLDCQAKGMRERRPKQRVNDALRALAIEKGAHYVDFNDLICPNGSCSAHHRDEALYYDGSHLSMSGSWTLGRMAVEAGATGVFRLETARPAAVGTDASTLKPVAP